MEKILEKAHELGALIKETKEVKALEKAKEAYENDKELQDLIGEFNLHRMAMMNEAQSEKADEKKVEELEKRVKSVYEKIMQTSGMKEMQKASADVEKLVGEVNGIINFYVTGEQPHSCGGSCETCGEGCNH